MADINDLKDICISSGTLRAEDLLPKFMGILKDYAPEKFNEFIKGYPELDDWEDFLEADWRIISDDTKMNASDELFGLLNDIAPEGTMFSSTEGDGSDFGFWSVEEKKSEADDDNKDLRIGLYYTEEELAILKDIFKKYVQEISGIRFSVPKDYTISYEISDDPLGDFDAVVKATGKKGKTIYLCNLHGEVLWAVNTPKQFWHYVGQVDPKTGEEKKDKYVIPPRSFFLDDEYYDNVKPSTRIPLLPSDWDKVDDYFKKFFKKRGEGFLDYDEGEKDLKQMAKGGKTTGQIAADIRYDVATALDMAADKAEDLMTKFGLDNIYVLRAQGLSPKAIAKRILKACESKNEAALRPWRTDFEKDLQKRIDDAKGTKYDTKDFTADGWEFVTGDVYDGGSEYGSDGKDVAVAFFKREQDGQYYRMWLAFDPDTKEITGGKWWRESDESKDERRDSADYLQEVWDALVPVWDKEKFDMAKGYDDEYECEAITITSKDNAGVRAKIYVDDHEGKHPVGFDVIYRYPGDKGVGDLGYYEFQSTDFDETAPEIFAYFDELKGKVGEAKDKFVVGMMISLDGVKQYIRELKPRTFVGQSVDTGKEFSLPISSLNRASILYDPRNESKKSEAYNWIAFYFCKDKRTGTEYAVIPQDRVFVVGNGGGRYNLSYLDANGHWDRLSYGYFATSCEPISDPENSKVYATVKADEDRRIIALTESEFDTIVEADDAVKTVKSIVANNYESKKSESLTLKQKELKDMARYGEAEDITTISDAEAKELKKKGIETVGVSRGTYGMNGALLRDREGNKYVITARSSNLFYFV